ncbi:MAG TPA: NUDIX domain-containing protein [Geobacterales bacterium]|nr:NUDIX domain-containing protein [Geobacterales bacterium]
MIKYTVSALIKNDKKEFLIVKRNPDEKEHPNMWGLPALSFKPPEMPEHALERLGIEKLNCKIQAIAFIGAMFQRRPGYDIFLMLYEAKIIEGEPNVEAKGKYAEQKWTSDPSLLLPIAKKGSACAQIYLHSLGVINESELMFSLSPAMLYE